MACMLYVKIKTGEQYLGRFRNREKAEAYYKNWLKAGEWDRAPTYTLPIYVETRRKGSQK